jgi:hypothetical protein
MRHACEANRLDHTIRVGAVRAKSEPFATGRARIGDAASRAFGSGAWHRIRTAVTVPYRCATPSRE